LNGIDDLVVGNVTSSCEDHYDPTRLVLALPSIRRG
jgi:Zn-dependent membrane protease YugP